MRKPPIVALLAMGVFASLAAIPLFALAQSSPPAPPAALIHGSISGASPGQHVVAFVMSQTGATSCGAGPVVNDPTHGIVYAVDVERHSTVPGCAAPGRQVRLYVPSTGSSPARFANQVVTLGSAEYQVFHRNLTLQPPLTNRLVAPQVGAHVSH